MFKIFLAFTKKEFAHILRDRRTLFILIAMPLALVFIFGYTVTNEFKDASIAVVDQAKDELSLSLVEHLTASGHFRLVELPETASQLERSFQQGKVKLGIILPPNFEASFYREKKATLQLIADATEPNYAATLSNYATQMIRSFQAQHGQSGGLPYQIQIETRMLYNPQLIGAYNFIPGVVALILMIICAMMTSLTIAKEKETGTMDLLLISPLPPMLIIIGKVTPYAVLSFLDALMVFGVGNLLFDVPIHGSLTLLLALTVLYLIVALGLGVLISTVAPNQQLAMMASLFALMLPTMLLSGFLFPLSSMPWLLQSISHIIPAKYFIQIEQAIMLKGAGFETIAWQSLVLFIMMAVLLSAARRNFKVVYED
ncbi:MAG: ABC transporter permease [Bacteroidota bacterium]